MLEGLNEVPWSSLAQPTWNRPGSAEGALRRLAFAASEKEAMDAYHDFLYAVGNDHAGTYYPIVLATLPFLGEILQSGRSLGSVANTRRSHGSDVLVLAGSWIPNHRNARRRQGREATAPPRRRRAVTHHRGDGGRLLGAARAAELLATLVAPPADS
jgi:hypothetical protein